MVKSLQGVLSLKAQGSGPGPLWPIEKVTVDLQVLCLQCVIKSSSIDIFRRCFMRRYITNTQDCTLLSVSR